MKQTDTPSDPTERLRGLQSSRQRRIIETIEKLKARYVRSERDEAINVQIQRLIDNACIRKDPRLPHSEDNRCPGIGFMLTGESGAGKTTAMLRAFRDHPAFPGYGVTNSRCPLVSVAAPSPFNLKQLGVSILNALGYATDRDMRENVVWQRVRAQIRLQGILFLHIDDCQDVLLLADEKEIRKVRNTLKSLMTSFDWPLQLILSGLPELIPFSQADRQVRRRLKYVQLRPVSVSEDWDFIDEAIRDYAKAAGLKFGIRAGDELVERLTHTAHNAMGLVFELLLEAIEIALKSGRKGLRLVEFADVYAARTLQSADQNPFMSDEWSVIDTSLIRPKSEDMTPEDIEADDEDRGHRRPPKRRRSGQKR